MGIPALIAAVVLSSGSVPPPQVNPSQPGAREAATRIAATVHMAAAEYALAWTGARFTNPEEAGEAQAFVSEARRAASSLGGSLARDAEQDLDALAALLERRAPADSVAAGAAALEKLLASRIGVALDERPARAPSLADGERIYAERCAQCHGGLGRGDGPAAKGLTPPPADLTVRTATGPLPADYFRRVTYGTPGTAMPAFGAMLSVDQRWDVIAHVLTLSDSMAARAGNGVAAVTFAAVRATLGGAMARARSGDRHAADGVFDAYLAFEAVEGPVRIADAPLANRAEQRFAALRGAVAARALTLDDQYVELIATLDSAEAAVTAPHTGMGLLAESFLLIVREGFEAILIVAAIMAVVLRSGSTEQRRHVRWGVVLALAASVATAALLERIFEASAAKREALEGGVMLVASGVLFYVSYWLFSKVDARTWQRFVKEKVERAAAAGSGLALASVAFLAVYREGFETVLFYKALYVTGGGGAGGAAPITAGLAAGAVVLVALYVGIEKFGIRIPLRPFFAVTGATLYFMAFVFAGAGVKELQEGAYLPTTLVPGAPRWEFFGIYPTVESLALQGVIVLGLVIAIAVWVERRRRRAAAAASEVPETR